MEKRIVALSSNPHTVGLADRKCSLFIDATSGSIFVDEGDGEGRCMASCSLRGKKPSVCCSSAGSDHRLVLDYGGVQYLIGVSEAGSQLRSWAAVRIPYSLPEEGRPLVGKQRGPIRRTGRASSHDPKT